MLGFAFGFGSLCFRLRFYQPSRPFLRLYSGPLKTAIVHMVAESFIFGENMITLNYD